MNVGIQIGSAADYEEKVEIREEVIIKKVITTIIITNGVLIKGIFILRDPNPREDQQSLKRAQRMLKRLEDGRDYAIEIWAKNTTKALTSPEEVAYVFCLY